MDTTLFKQLERRFGAEPLKRRLELEKDPFNKKMVFGFWYIKLRHQRAFLKGVQFFLKLLGLWQWGRKNAHAYVRTDHTVRLPRLPSAFRNFRILHLSDLHIECMGDEGDSLLKFAAEAEADLCVITGDFRYRNYGDSTPTIDYMKRLVRSIRCPEGVIGILGNHDPIEMAPSLESLGMRMLLNENFHLNRNGQKLWIVGVDDPHYFKLHDLSKAIQGIPDDACRILLAHSPEIVPLAAEFDIDLYLCGHAHGGQICLPGEIPIIANTICPRKYFRGSWKHNQMVGYTSRGTGASGLPIRFFSKPEVIVHTLG